MIAFIDSQTPWLRKLAQIFYISSKKTTYETHTRNTDQLTENLLYQYHPVHYTFSSIHTVQQTLKVHSILNTTTITRHKFQLTPTNPHSTASRPVTHRVKN